MNVSDEVFGRTQECPERRIAITSAKYVAVRRDYHFDQPGRGPVFSEQASEYRLEVIADLHGPEFSEAVLSYLIRFTDGDVVCGHGPHRIRRFWEFEPGGTVIWA